MELFGLLFIIASFSVFIISVIVPMIFGRFIDKHEKLYRFFNDIIAENLVKVFCLCGILLIIGVIILNSTAPQSQSESYGEYKREEEKREEEFWDNYNEEMYRIFGD